MPEVSDYGRVVDIDVRGFVDIDVDMNMWILMCVILK